MIAPPGSVIDPYECPRREGRHPMAPDGAQEVSLLTGIIRRAAAASACAGHRRYILEGPVMALGATQLRRDRDSLRAEPSHPKGDRAHARRRRLHRSKGTRRPSASDRAGPHLDGRRDNWPGCFVRGHRSERRTWRASYSTPCAPCVPFAEDRSNDRRRNCSLRSDGLVPHPGPAARMVGARADGRSSLKRSERRSTHAPCARRISTQARKSQPQATNANRSARESNRSLESAAMNSGHSKSATSDRWKKSVQEAEI
jgi:hypothetical protein